MTNENMTPEDHFDDLKADLEEEVNMVELEHCSNEGLCALFQNDEKPYVANLMFYRERSAFKEGSEDYTKLKKLDEHVKSCYFCSEYYACSPVVEFDRDMKALVDNVEKEFEKYKSEKPKNSEEPKNE